MELTRSAVAPDDLEMRYLSSLLSRRDRIALLVATGLGIGFGYLTGLGGLVFGFPYTFLIIPCVVVIFADQRKLLVWQVCVFSFLLYLLTKINNDVGLRRGETLRVGLLFWALVEIFSSPIPLGFLLLRLKGRARYIAGVTIAVVVLALLLLIHRIMVASS